MTDSLTTTSDAPQPPDLAPARFVDSDSTEVREFTARVTDGIDDPVGKAVALFVAVRDEIWYDPFCLVTDPAAYRASTIAAQGNNWCVPKAVLLTAAARAAGIPARLGFADVRNHLNTERLRARMGGADLFVFHGYTALYLDRRWVKVTPAFNAELCARFGVDPIGFDGRTDALMHPYDGDGDAYMEYVHDRGQYTDLPLDELLTTFRAYYGEAMFGSVDPPSADAARAGDPVRDTFTR